MISPALASQAAAFFLERADKERRDDNEPSVHTCWHERHCGFEEEETGGESRRIVLI